MRIGGYLRRGGHTSGSGFNKEGLWWHAAVRPPWLHAFLTVMVLECVVCTDSPGAVNHRPESSDKGSQR